MISVITAIYNQRAVNELFWEHLQRATRNPFELIIIDNGSTDGSAELARSAGARVVDVPVRGYGAALDRPYPPAACPAVSGQNVNMVANSLRISCQ